MSDLKDVLQRIRAKKQERKKVNEVFRDVLSQSKRYQEVLEELKALKAKKKHIEIELQRELISESEKAERLAQDLKTDVQLLSDMALTKFMKGETIEVTDENDVKYEPVFKVTFKKSN